MPADIAKGAKVFRKCKACHLVTKESKRRIGPHLSAIMGRDIASLIGYKYSKAMRAYAKQNGTWNEQRMRAYLANPKKEVKGGRMAFIGIRKEKDMNNLIAYLKSLP